MKLICKVGRFWAIRMEAWRVYWKNVYVYLNWFRKNGKIKFVNSLLVPCIFTLITFRERDAYIMFPRYVERLKWWEDEMMEMKTQPELISWKRDYFVKTDSLLVPCILILFGFCERYSYVKFTRDEERWKWKQVDRSGHQNWFRKNEEMKFENSLLALSILNFESLQKAGWNIYPLPLSIHPSLELPWSSPVLF